MNQPASATTGSNGHSPLHDLFALTDEQILEIEPEAQDVGVASVAPASLPANSAEPAQHSRLEACATTEQDVRNANQGREETQTAQARVPLRGKPELHEPPAWLAETMNDPARGAEARTLWESAQRAEQEAAAYREVFAKPEEARAAAVRARQLDDIDRAYFARDATQRAQLAAMMMREDPAAFREMVFEGLRALEQAGQAHRTTSIADALTRGGHAVSAAGATLASPGATGAGASQSGASPAPIAHSNRDGQSSGYAAQQAQLAAYAAFERAANEDLERSVGSAIERTLEQALPATGRADSAALKGRMATAIRQDIEKALQGDRQLGEQVAQILSGKRLDNETRAQVVRLIGDRAQQLVSGAAKRALNDWTQTTLSAHRAKSGRADSVPRADVSPAVSQGGSPASLSAKSTPRGHGEKNRGATPRGSSNSSRLDYRKLSDDQILDM
jgi:hypothetical protein